MTTRNQVLKLAASQLGYTEGTGYGGRSNYTKYWAKLKPEYQGQPWCAAYVNWVLNELGVTDLLTGPTYPFYTPSMEQWAKKEGRWKASKDCRPGDVLIFGSSAGATHTGFLEKQDGNYVITLEGNTSSGTGGSQTDGGGVYRRRRPRSWVRGCISLYGILNEGMTGKTGPGSSVSVPAGPTSTSGPTEPRGPFPLPKGHWYGPNDGTSKSHSGAYAGAQGKKDKGAIKLIQQKLNKELGSKLTVDGEYGPKTVAAVKVWQRKYKLTADGEVGAVTWATM